MTLPTIERDKGGDYVTRVRPSDLEPVDTEAERARNQDDLGRAVDGNVLGKDRGAKHALTGPLKDIRDAVEDASGGALAPEDSRKVMRSALKLYVANRRALGTGKVPVLARLVRVSVNDALATYFTAQAALAGFSSEAGLAYIDAAHRCENRAERAMTSAIAFAKAIDGKHRKGVEPAWLETDGEEAT